MRNPILVALDLPTAEAALELAGQLAPVVGGFKIGSELFTSEGPEIVRRIRATGAAVFLDLKFHDIPNTVAKAVAAATRLDVRRSRQRRRPPGSPDALRRCCWA
jgi:orotidine-5'-phosphate decarboxylase